MAIFPTAVPVPQSPSYPSEHAAAAQAAASVLAFFLPEEAQSFPDDGGAGGMVARAGGRSVPGDHIAGLALGQKVAERVIAQAMADGSSIPPTGIGPTGPCKWIGTNPGNQAAANWSPLLLTSPSASSDRRLHRRALGGAGPGRNGEAVRHLFPARS